MFVKNVILRIKRNSKQDNVKSFVKSITVAVQK